jgi:hypothetical protein
MSNFKVIENLDFDTSLIIIDESQLLIDNRYFSIYREKYDINKILEIIKSAVLQKILEKEFSYKDEENIEIINNKLNIAFNKLEIFSTNDIYDDDEKGLIVEVIKDLILFNKEINKKIDTPGHSLNTLFLDSDESDDESYTQSNRFNRTKFYYRSLNNIFSYLKNCCIIAKNKAYQGLRYAKIKFVEYVGNINLGFL